jgi:aarF domain-containing kinase
VGALEIHLPSGALAEGEHHPTDDIDQKSHKSQLQEDNVAATAQMPGITSQTLNPRSKERAVPASRLGRVWQFGGLAAGLTAGALAERTRKAMGQKSTSTSSSFLSDQNMERIVDTLCRVRGAALKLGQMISIQDEAFVSPKVQRIFERVRNSADFMPMWQMERVLCDELGKDWNSKLKEFDYRPIAAASIGQVHRGVLHDDKEVAIKIQYPGVAESIDSDVNNLLSILSMAKIMPDGLFLEKAADVARKELAWETDYIREAESSGKFRTLLCDDPSFVVPRVISELSSKRVLTTEMVYGIPMDQVVQLDQQTKTEVAYLMLKLSLREVFEFQFMQTDPNWSNFFYNTETKKIALLDFGASREYSKDFTDLYIKIIKAAADRDRATVIKVSKQIGFLTGYESKAL